MTDNEVIRRFRALYGGGLAQKYREAAGDEKAMPPWAETWWLGKQVVKCPMDLWIYQELIVQTRPDVLLETGTSGSGSAFFFATLFDLIGHGYVVTVDKDAYPHLLNVHPRITYLTGDAVEERIVAVMRARAAGQRTMVSLDSLHTYEHVTKELAAYAPLVAPGCYLVVEDVNAFDADTDLKAIDRTKLGRGWGTDAVIEFSQDHPEFTRDVSREKHLLTSNVWLRRDA